MPNRRQHGFTLVELMITIMVAAILLVVAVPAMQTLVQNNRLTTQTNDFVSALQLARSEAAKRNRQITVTTRSAGGGWEVLDNQIALRVVQPLTGGNNLSAPTGAWPLQFRPDGGVTTGGAFPLRFDLCPPEEESGVRARQVQLDLTGRVSSRTCERCGCPGGAG